jgi:hypothetical protein
MGTFAEKIYLGEIAFQLECAKRSLDSLQNSSIYQAKIVHRHINDFVNHLAVVSKILRPSAGKDPNDPRRVRGRHLRTSLRIDDQHPILDRSLRDLLEHIDEQLDEWVGNMGSNRGIFVDLNVGNQSGIVVEGLMPHEYTMRHFDPSTTKYVVRSHNFQFVDLVRAANDVLEKVNVRLLHIEQDRRVAPVRPK